MNNVMGPQLPTKKNNYFRNFPEVGQIKLIGCVGLQNIGFLKNTSDKEEKFDLNLLLDEAIHKPDDLDPKLTELLQFLSENYNKLSSASGRNLTGARFFCYRGLMTMIATTPYEHFEGWKMAVILFNGDIYLCMRKTEEKKLKEQNVTAKQKQCTAWGYKFEQFLLSATPRSDPDPNTPNNELAEFSCFYKRNINQHTVIYGAEMDGVIVDNDAMSDPPKDADPETVLKYLEPLKFVELKTHAHFHLGNAEHNFRAHKAMKTWCQCWLTDVQTIVVGFRNNDGIVERRKTYSLDDIKNMRKNWNPEVCVNFLDAFFTYVKKCLAYLIETKYGLNASDNIQDLPLTTMLLEWKPHGNVTMSENWDNDSDVVMTSWYIDIIKGLNQKRPSDGPETSLPSRSSSEHSSQRSVPYRDNDRELHSRSRNNPDYRDQGRPSPGPIRTTDQRRQGRQEHRHRSRNNRNRNNRARGSSNPHGYHRDY